MKFIKVSILITILNIFCITITHSSLEVENGYCSSKSDANQELCGQADGKLKRFLLYDVNSGEGFNLRRDVFLRVANLVHKLNEIEPWTLVLPPWGHLYHWRSEHRNMFYSWNNFFDIKSINKWIPAVEFKDFLDINGNSISSSFVLQHFKEGWGEKFEEKYELRPCIEDNNFMQVSSEKWSLHKWNQDLTVGNFSCVSFQGHASFIIPLLTEEQKNSRTVMLDRAETLLHDDFSGSLFWSARRSVRFASDLIQEAADYRRIYLRSNDESDNTVVHYDWTKHKPVPRTAIGGPYVAVHLRRRDFVHARGLQVPSLHNAASQLRRLMRSLRLNVLFVATDAPQSEFDQLRDLLSEFSVERYEPPMSLNDKDGSVAIIEQIICSHAKFFIGSYESTFSFRIQEEREILGFSPDSTFNRLCGDEEGQCSQPTRWSIVY